jgi:hypothetical protein
MIDSVEMKLGSLESKKFFPKIVGESWISFRVKIIRHALDFEYGIHKNMS